MRQVFITVLFALFACSGWAQTKPVKVSLDTLPFISYPEYRNRGFQSGEYLRFRLHYGIIDAGEAELTVSDRSREYQGRKTLHMVGTGRTLGAFNWFFKVDDRYESFLDYEGLFPWEFVRDIKEGGYSKKENYRFYQHKAAVKTQKGDIFGILPWSQDMLSCFYYARSLDFTNIQEGDLFSIPTFVDEEIYPLQIKFIGRETISSRTGTYRCLKFVPVLQEGRIFKEEQDMVVWITDDANRIPVLAKAKILVGSIKMELVEYKNIAYPLAKLD